MLARLHRFHYVADVQYTVLQRRDVHAQTGTWVPVVDDAVRAHRRERLVAVCDASLGIDIGQLAAGCAARNVQGDRGGGGGFGRCCNAGFCPVVFGKGGGACDVDVCAEAEGVDEGEVVLPVVFALFLLVDGGGEVVDRGEVEKVERILLVRVSMLMEQLSFFLFFCLPSFTIGKDMDLHRLEALSPSGNRHPVLSVHS